MMKNRPILLLSVILFSCLSAISQDQQFTIRLKSGSFIPERNITAENLQRFSNSSRHINQTFFAILQFDELPGEEKRRQLDEAGIVLHDFIPGNAFTASIKSSIEINDLTNAKVRSVVEVTPAMKMESVLGQSLSSIRNSHEALKLWISYTPSFTKSEVLSELNKLNISVLPTLYDEERILSIEIPGLRLESLGELPCIEFIQRTPPVFGNLNNKSIINSRANVLTSQLPGGRALTGNGVAIGIGDDSNPNTHGDFSGRLIDRHTATGGAHGIHVMGTASGGGIVDEKYKGYAPLSTIIAQSYANIIAYAPAYIADYNMVITNNSYGYVTDDCVSFGVYDLYSRMLDQQSRNYPYLQHVFAVGNSGRSICGSYTPTFGNVLGGFQSSKNAISVGNTTENDSLHYVSSKGPVKDGRIKPEITAQGRNVISSWPVNIYSFNTGTSMAAPAVSGGLALLWERYRALYSSDPKSGLMKALLCNGANDLGNPGPDYTYGFGWMNLLRSVIMLEKNNFFTSSVSTGNVNNHVVNLPAGLAKLKVMLYWNDTAASVLSSQSLVHDLDLEVIDPSTGIHLPFLLDTAKGNENVPAGNGADHINNIEQVVIDAPAAGNYIFRVKGTSVALSSSQEYFVVFDTIAVSTVLTAPIGGEKLSPGDSIYITWDSWGAPNNNFTIEYKKDNSSSWVTLNNNISASARQYKWMIPTTDTTTEARIRITRNGTSMVSTSEPFTIIGSTLISLASVQCEGYIGVKWNKVPGITDYEVMLLRNNIMVPVGTTTDTNFVISGVSRDSFYYVSVRTRLNGNPGLHGWAVSRQPNTGNCSGNISDNDIILDTIVSPAYSGRFQTSTAFTSTTPIRIRLKNIDDAASSENLTVSYYVNGSLQQTEVINPTIAAGATYEHVFSLTQDFSSVGTYNIKAVVAKTSDPNKTNDTCALTVKQLPNDPITLAQLPFIDNLETGVDQVLLRRHNGLEGLERYDFARTSNRGRLRTYLNFGMAYSGSKAITLDNYLHNAPGNTDSLTATFNLATINAAVNDMRLDFRYKNHGQTNHASNKVWIRGNDGQPWIQAFDLFANQNPVNGTYKLSSSIEVSDLLAANGQSFTASFQVRFGQYGQFTAADNDGRSGYTFDDIRLYVVTDDIQVLSIDTPSVSGCGLTNAEPVRVFIRNSANHTVSTIPVTLEVNGTVVATEIISSIAANTTIAYTFNPATANLSAFGDHIIRVWSSLGSDTYKNNDTTSLSLYNAPVITSYPYLEDFESGQGSWHAAGTNSSWEYGTPASIKISRAASGSKAWKTTLSGFYRDKEVSYLYSPCFDLSGMTTPTLSFSMALDLEDCGSGFCDGAWVEYSTDGENWSKLGSFGQGTNWYNKNYSGTQLWSRQDYTRWHVATTALPTTNNSRLRLRFVIFSDAALSREGVAIDDIHVYDNTMGIYDGVTMSSPVTQNISGGNNWIDFTTGGKLIASLKPANQSMGNVDAQAYLHTGAVRNVNGQYFHNRNITIKPQVLSYTDSVSVRFYFLDSETELLIAASGCGTCTKPSMAYELGVSKYSDPVDAVEDGDINNSVGMYWSFIAANRLRLVPFDKGYYAEFKVKNFSEFWLNNGGPDNNHPLPVELTSFTARRSPDQKDAILQWITASEINTLKFEIEVARSDDEFNRNRFHKIGEVAANGNSTIELHYSFTDNELNKSGTRYYRLKIVDIDGSYSYSLIRPVNFSNDIEWVAYPNPTGGIVNVVYRLNAGEQLNLNIYDVTGRKVSSESRAANGFIQKITVDLSSPVYAPGLYLIEASGPLSKQTFRLVKQ